MRQVLFPEGHPDVAESLDNMGVVYGLLGKHQMALKYKLLALEARMELYKGANPKLADSLNNVGVSYDHLGNQQKALEYMLRALEMR